MWLAGEDTSQQPTKWLGDLFQPGARVAYWDLIEPVTAKIED